MSERWLVTGASGCIGAWVVRVLLDEGMTVTTFDVDASPHRLDLVVGRSSLDQVQELHGDICDLDSVRDALSSSGATHVVHLAALQIPHCRANPSRGAAANVVGTVNMFEAVRELAGQVAGLTYASSAAAYDALEAGDPGTHGDLRGHASTLYGVYKRANEGTAQVYWQDHRVASIGLRPHTVYGPGRDQGVTSQPTMAMLAAARGERYEIGFGGRVPMQFARDVASDFVAAARSARDGAVVVNVTGTPATVDEIVDTIVDLEPSAIGRITHLDVALPFPGDLVVEGAAFEPQPRTSLRDGIRATMDCFRREQAS